MAPNPTYQPIEKGGLGAEIVHYFHVTNAERDGTKEAPRTIHDFLDDCGDIHYPNYKDLGFEIRSLIQKLVNEGLLYSVGFDPHQRLPLNEQFLSYEFSSELAEYGSYEFVLFGFREVRNHFLNSVLPIHVKEPKKPETIGTCFAINSHRLITDFHCLPPSAYISLPGWKPTEAKLMSIRTFGVETEIPPYKKIPKIDLAVLQFENDPFPNVKKFKLWTGDLFDQILCMGYPLMRCFESILVTSTGEIVGKETPYLSKESRLVFSARVKSGNSGGPIVNRLGKVVGVVAEMLSEDGSKPDVLGFGLATPAQRLFELLTACDANEPNLFEVPFINTVEGFLMR